MKEFVSEARERIRRQLDSSPRISFVNRIYREFQAEILKIRPRNLKLSTRGDSISLKDRLQPYYTHSVSNFEVQQKLLRWYRTYSEKMLGKVLISEYDGWKTNYKLQ